MIVKTFTFNPFQVNTYLIYDETKEAVIIDPGCYKDTEREELTQFIENENLKIVRLLNTHLHLDHQFGNKYVSDKYKVLPEAGVDDEFFIESAPSQAKMFGLNINETSPALKSYLKNDDIIEFGNSFLKTIHVPGHSPGSIVFYSEKNNFIIAGDVLFKGSIGRTDLEKGDYATLITSITNKLLILPEETFVFCGHGPTTTIGYEKENNPYL